MVWLVRGKSLVLVHGLARAFGCAFVREVSVGGVSIYVPVEYQHKYCSLQEENKTWQQQSIFFGPPHLDICRARSSSLSGRVPWVCVLRTGVGPLPACCEGSQRPAVSTTTSRYVVHIIWVHYVSPGAHWVLTKRAGERALNTGRGKEGYRG